MPDPILLVDDDQDHCEVLAFTLRELGYQVAYTTAPREALELIVAERFAAVITDIGMLDMDGLELCTRIIGTRGDAPVIVLTGNGSMDVAISAMRAGAYDFLTKPVDEALLGSSVARAVLHHALVVEVKRLREESFERTAVGSLVGKSPTMNNVHDLVARVGRSDVSVLIEGETGTGKELVARALHAAGARRAGPFVAVNCGAVPAQLLESELFGHVRGAFTDASAARVGLFMQASGGTLLLDEIGDMPLEMQTKVLRAIQERTVRPVGSNDERPFDARVLTATHRNLEIEVAAKRFREDLYYRINVVKIVVPPLRERSEDILALAEHFLRKCAERSKKGPMVLSPEVAAPLLTYAWPGNVRELENCIERAVALARLDHLSVEDLPEKVVSREVASPIFAAKNAGEILTLEEVDRRYIERAIALVEGNMSRAAILLGLDRRTLYRRLEKYEGRIGLRPGGNGETAPTAAPPR